MRALLARQVTRFVADTSGATAIEYGLICAILFLGIVASIRNLLSVALLELFDKLGATLMG